MVSVPVQIFNELEILSSHHHPSLCNAYYAFQDDDNLYLVMDLALGGDLKFQLSANRRFEENHVKFLIATVVLAIEYLHTQNILHRDIKPANLLMKSNGHIMLTDFGLSVRTTSLNPNEVSGTDGFISPEMYQHRISTSHTTNSGLLLSSDWFALGVTAYLFAMGDRPWKYTRDMTKDSTEYITSMSNLAKAPLSANLKSFITQLTEPSPETRLGTEGGAQAVINHPWFEGFDWEGLRNGTMEAPYKPDISKKNVDRRISVMDLEEQLVGFKADVPKVDRQKQFLFEKYELNTELTEEDRQFLAKRQGCTCVLL
eukprot:c6533_g1_i2.p1 GENE.c6533_g1_i2~~c6533_g1_i2.p1  ORF type:complete len:314 (+),score=52.78 c6533_g1_i2:109-1050(+)